MRLDRNKSTEKDLRDYLDRNGYFGRTAKFHFLRLKAVERPGWVQVFQFEIEAKRTEGDWEHLFGYCRTDERSDLFEAELSADGEAIERGFDNAASEMITHKTAGTQSPFVGLLFTLLVVSILGAGVLFYQKNSNSRRAAIELPQLPQAETQYTD